MLKLFLAPMEGVVDWAMRDLLTSVGGIDLCVTEFLRVTTQLHSDKIFYKNCPELLTNSRTRAGVPVFVQLLGGQPEPLAANAVRAAELGALGIDFNFGCPAKTVNRHDGGASLLKFPNRIYDILKLARSAVPAEIPVTAKIRLGFDNPTSCLENAKAAEEAGVSWLTVHCRTKMDGYKPPAYWDWIPKIKNILKIPIVVNGEIWSTNDWVNCSQQTNADTFMIGRGAISNPYIFSEIKSLAKASYQTKSEDTLGTLREPSHLGKLIMDFYVANCIETSDQFAVARTKQWMNSLSKSNLHIKSIFDRAKLCTNPGEFKSLLENELENLIV